MQRSGLDEEFKVFLGVTVGYHLNGGDKTYRAPLLRTLRHNHRLLAKLSSSMQRIVLRSPAMTAKVPALAVRLDANVHDTVVERSVRGLFFYHTGQIIGDRYVPIVRWHQTLNVDMVQLTKDWSTGTVGTTALVYKFAIGAEDPRISCWILQFFQKTWSTVVFQPLCESAIPDRTPIS